MGIRSRVQEDVADFRKGLNDGYNTAGELPDPRPGQDVFLGRLAGLSKVTLYGFLLAYSGVPFLPWSQRMALVATVAAVALGTLHLPEQPRKAAMRFVAVVVLAGLVLWSGDGSTTSVLLIGAVITAAISLAANYPFVYGIVALVALGGVVVQIFDLTLFRPQQLIFSGRPFTPDQAGIEALRFAGFMFLSAIAHTQVVETKRFKSKAAAAEAERDEAVSDERARIARELHDVVSHHVTAMTLQAEAASLTGDRHALASVATAGREALTELRSMLGVLRHPSGPDDSGGGMEPQPGVEQLDRLADRTTAGLEVRIDRQGDVRPLAAGVELCIYRLVQEALTNSAKHGDASTVDVALTYAADAVTVDIRDNGSPLASPRVQSNGLGLIGMQERVTLLDGELSTGPRSDGAGYQVVARVPLAS